MVMNNLSPGLRNSIYLVLLTFFGSSLSYFLLGPESTGSGMLSAVLFASWIFFIYLAQKETRDMHESLSFGKGFGLGMLVTLFYALSNGVFIWIYTALLSPEYLELQYKKALQSIETVYSDEQMEMAQGILATFMTPMGTMLSTVFSYLFLGLIIALILAAIMQKKKPFVEFN